MDGISRKDVSDCEDTDTQRAVKASHGCHEEDWTIDGLDLGVLECLNMRNACPAHLLEDSAEEGCRCLC